MAVRSATSEDLPALEPLVHGYCKFYELDPPREGVERVMRLRIDDPDRHGPLFVAADSEGNLVGFAALAWKASHLHGGEVAYLYDLFVAENARGAGHADELIAACADAARRRGCVAMDWLTAPSNARAQAVYDRAGATAEPYLEYELEL